MSFRLGFPPALGTGRVALLPGRANPQSLRREHPLQRPLRLRRGASRAHAAPLQKLRTGWRTAQSRPAAHRREEGRKLPRQGVGFSGVRTVRSQLKPGNLLPCDPRRAAGSITHPFWAPDRRSQLCVGSRCGPPPSRQDPQRWVSAFSAAEADFLWLASWGGAASAVPLQASAEASSFPAGLSGSAYPGRFQNTRLLSLLLLIKELAFSMKKRIAHIVGFSVQDQSLSPIWLFFPLFTFFF